MSPREPEQRKPTPQEETAFYNSVSPPAEKFARSLYRSFPAEYAHDVALSAVSRTMSEWCANPDEVTQQTWMGRIINRIKREFPKAIQRATRRRKFESRSDDPGGEAAANDVPVDRVASDARADGPIISSQGFAAARARIELIEDPERREVMLLKVFEKMKPKAIAEQLGMEVGAVNAHLKGGVAVLRPVMKLYVAGEQLPDNVIKQMNKESK